MGPAAAALVVFAADVAAADVAATGAGAGVGDADFDPNHECLAGEGETAATGDVASSVVVARDLSFLTRLCLAGEASGTEEAAAGDSAAAGEASFLACLCLAGLGEFSGLAAGEGDWAERVARERPINATMRPTGLFMVRRA